MNPEASGLPHAPEPGASRPGKPGPGSWAQGVRLGLHGLTMVCLVLALTPLGGDRAGQDRIVILVDVSRSVCCDVRSGFAGARPRLDSLLETLDRDTRVWLVAFGRRPVPWMGPVSPATAREALARGESPPVGDAGTAWETRLDLALIHAASLLGEGPGGGVVVVGDGQNMGPGSHEAARALGAQGHRLHCLSTPLGPPPMGDLFLAEIQTPLQVRPGEAIRMRVRIGGTGRLPRAFALRVQEDGIRGPGRVKRGQWPGVGDVWVGFRFRGKTEDGVRTFSVALEEPEGRREYRDTPADQTRVAVVTGNPTQILWVGRSGALPRAFQDPGPGFAVRRGDLDRAGLARADVVVLEDVRFDGPLLDAARAAVLAEAVARGTGLLALGGRESFGPGGWGRTRIETLLPLRMDRPGPPLDVVLVLDRSGSMAAGDRWNRAVYGAAAFLAGLRPGDRVRVVTFAGGVRTALAWRTVDSRDPGGPGGLQKSVVQILARIRPHGPTHLAPAVEAAVEGLEALSTVPGAPRRRRLVILSDGRLAEPTDRFEALGARLLGLAVEPGIVATGDSLSAGDRVRLEALTLGNTHGRLVVVEETGDLEAAFRSAGNPEWWVIGPLAVSPTGISPPPGLEMGGAFPDLGLLIRTSARKSGCTLLAVGPESEPVLALGRSGEGRVAAFPGSLRQAGGEGWNQPGLWRSLVQWLSGPGSGRGQPLGRIRLSRGRLEADVTVAAEFPLTGWTLRIGDRTIPLEPLAPGRVGARVEGHEGLESFGEVILEGRIRSALPVLSCPGEELQAVGIHVPALKTLAREGMGQFLETEDGAPGWPPDRGGNRKSPDPLWLILALAFFLAGRGVKSLWIRGR